MIDVTVFVNINTTKMLRTFGEYCLIKFTRKVRRILESVAWLDFVFDTYKSDSIKEQTRENRGKGIRISGRKQPQFGENFKTLWDKTITRLSCLRC